MFIVGDMCSALFAWSIFGMQHDEWRCNDIVNMMVVVVVAIVLMVVERHVVLGTYSKEMSGCEWLG